MNSIDRYFLAHDHAAELLREAQRERLRRAALAVTRPGRTHRFGIRIAVGWWRRLIPRPAG